MKIQHWLVQKQYLWAALIVMAIVFLCFWPWLNGEASLAFIGDGAFSYFTYKLIYTDLVSSGTFPLWNFGNLYGQPMQHMYIFVGATKYLTMAIGVAFGVTNVYLLFIGSIFLELAILVLGMMLLAKHFRIHPVAAVIATLCLALMTKWQSINHFRHGILILLPLMFYYGIRFSQNLNFGLLAISGLLISLFSFGGAPYLSVLLFYQTIIFVILNVLTLRTYRSIGQLPHYLTHPRTVLLLIVCTTLGGLFFYTLQDLISGDIIIYRSGRLQNMSLSFSTFHKQVEIKSSGIFHQYRRYFYALGVAPLIFFLSAIYHSRKASFSERKYIFALAIFMALSALAVLDSSGLVTRFYYSLPGMKYYRYGDGFLTYAMASFVIIAMFGMSHYFRCQKSRRYSFIEIIFALVFLVSGLFLFDTHFAEVLSERQTKIPSLMSAYTIATHAPLLQLIGFGVVAAILGIFRFIKPSNNRWTNLTAILLMVVEIIVSYAFWVYGSVKHPGSETLVPRESIVQTFALPKMIPPRRRDNSAHQRIDLSPINPAGADTKMLLEQIRLQQISSGLKAKENMPYLNTGCNSVFLAAERLYPCISLLNGLFIGKPIETFFRNYGGFNDQIIAGLMITGGPSDQSADNAIKWFNNTPSIRHLLGCDSPIIRFSQSAHSLYSPHSDGSMRNQVTIKKYWGNEINFTANNNSGKSAWVIIADAMDEHWHSWVNGHPQPIQTANIAFKAVEVPPGKSDVILKYQNTGALISTWSIALMTSSLFILLFLMWLAELSRSLTSSPNSSLPGVYHSH